MKFYMSNKCFTTEEVPFLRKSCMQATTGELLSKTHIVVTFRVVSLTHARVWLFELEHGADQKPIDEFNITADCKK